MGNEIKGRSVVGGCVGVAVVTAVEKRAVSLAILLLSASVARLHLGACAECLLIIRPVRGLCGFNFPIQFSST